MRIPLAESLSRRTAGTTTFNPDWTEGLDVASLAFSEYGVESQRRLPAAAEPGHNSESAMGNVNVDVPEVVGSCTCHADAPMKTIMENPSAYGFHLRDDQLYQPRKYRTVDVNGPVADWPSWAGRQGINYAQLRDANPWIRAKKLTNRTGKKYVVRIPLADDRAKAGNLVHIGSFEAAEHVSCICREGLDVASLAFSEYGVEKNHSVELVVDRVVPSPKDRDRLLESVRKALAQGDKEMMVFDVEADSASSTEWFL